jgi:hypothetical protein
MISEDTPLAPKPTDADRALARKLAGTVVTERGQIPAAIFAELAGAMAVAISIAVQKSQRAPGVEDFRPFGGR